MTKLLSAYFLRLRKNYLFWGILAIGAGFAGFRLYSLMRDQLDYGIPASLNEAVFTYAQLIGLTAAVFVSLFLGTEYSDGTIRNKLVSGCSRLSIYLSGLLTVCAASFLSLAAYWVVAIAVGIPMFGPWKLTTLELLVNVLGILLMTAAFCAIFTFIAMNCPHKAASAVLCILLFFALLMASTYIYSRLEAPEFISGYEMSVNGEVVPTELEPNPRYLRAGQRTVYEFLRDLLPTGQSIQYSVQNSENPARLLGLSAALTAAFTAAGAALFNRKDLR